MVKKKFLVQLTLVILIGCAGGQLSKRFDLRNALSQGQFDLAMKSLQSMNIASDSKSKLLFYVEKGMIHFSAGQYYQSLLSFEEGKKIIEKLFTTQVGSKLLSVATNDSFDVYYGESYEKSLIHFYLALCHFFLHQNGKYEAYTDYPSEEMIKENKHATPTVVAERVLTEKEKQDELFRARAEILAWDSTLKSMRADKEGKSVFKDDLMAKIFGAFIHESMNKISDTQIALQLYKDAKKILFRNYNSYKTFNSQSFKFKKDFSSLPKLDTSQVKNEYVSETIYGQELSDFLDEKILSLTRLLSPRELKTVAKQLEVKSEILDQIKKIKKDALENNLSVILSEGFIPDKIPDRYAIGLEGAMRQSKDSKVASILVQVGAAAITAFASYELGLYPPRGGIPTPGSQIGVQVAKMGVENTAISFELPKINNYPINTIMSLEVKNQDGIKIHEKQVPVINPLGDIAEEALAEDSALKYIKVGTRVAVKHLSAIVAAYITYTALNRNSKQSFLAKSAAILEYMAASKAIEQSEKADVRYWSTLPLDYRMVGFSLPSGKYTLVIHFKNKDSGQEEKSINLGLIEIGDKEKKLFYSRIF